MHMLRTRKMGADAFVDVHIQVDSLLSVSEGHQISEIVRQQLVRNIEDVSDVTVHIDPEDDEFAAISCQLPSRKQIMARLHEAWQDIEAAKQIQSVTLHYLDGFIHVDVKLPLSLACVDTTEKLLADLKQSVVSFKEVQEIRIGFYTD